MKNTEQTKLAVYYGLVEFPIWLVYKFVQTFCFVFKADLLLVPLFFFNCQFHIIYTIFFEEGPSYKDVLESGEFLN